MEHGEIRGDGESQMATKENPLTSLQHVGGRTSFEPAPSQQLIPSGEIHSPELPHLHGHPPAIPPHTGVLGPWADRD